MKRTLMLALVAVSVGLMNCAGCDDDGGTGIVECGDDEQLVDQRCVPNEPTNNSNNDIDDRDGDGVPDSEDNCPDTPNPGQEDGDQDGVGDACDDCPEIANVSQMGCPSDDYDPDRDTDQDGVPDVADNCPQVANPDQVDEDGDGIGDACDGCPTVANDFADDLCATNVVTPAVNELPPNIYMLVDASGSMGNQLDEDRPKPWPIDEFKDAVNMLPNDLLNTARVGIGQFPFQPPPDPAATCTFRNWVGVDSGQADTIRDAADSIEPFGDTPTGYALQQVLDRELLDDPLDPQDNLRPKVVVLITDGDPTVACDSGAPVNSRDLAQPEAEAGAAALAAAGIPVYVVGFQSGAEPENLDAIAQAGGTNAPDPDRFHFVAENSAELVLALENIAAELVSCTLQLTDTTPEVDETRVSIFGIEQTEDPVDGYSYDEAQSVLTMNGQSCEEIKNSGDPGAVEIEATLVDRGMAPLCEPTGAEICDYVDNDCNDVVDEGCPGENEVCDGVDNDLDGEVDEGCP